MTSPKLLFAEFGTADFSLFRQAIGALPLGVIEVWKQVGSEVGNDAHVEGGLDEAMQFLLHRQTTCVRVTPKESEIKWLLLMAPNAIESDISIWHGMLELRSTSHEQVFQILKEARLQYVAVAKDEPFDLTDKELRPDKFPWNSPNFVAAALADQGEYVQGAPQ